MNGPLPAGFEDYFRRVWNRDLVDALVKGLCEDVPVSIRLNANRLPADAWPHAATAHVPWCPEGLYLSERPLFTADPLLHAGAYYVQEASSMFIAHVLRHLLASVPFLCDHTDAALDLCAAPGGKTTILRSLLPAGCLLVSNEPMRQRAQVLAENIAKWGGDNVVVTQAYARDIARVAASDRTFEGFGFILADVPCSGEGMIRKEEEAVRQWSPAFVAECADLQRSIVADIWPTLRPGGILIYSTCTFNPEEDELNVEWIASELGADVITIPTDPSWRILGDLRLGLEDESSARSNRRKLPCYHFIPGQVQGEGFFCAVLRKHENDGDDAKNAHFIESFATSISAVRSNKTRKNNGGKVAAQCFAQRLEANLTILPTNQLDAPGAPRVELSLHDAVRYLRREALILPSDTPKGIIQVAYRGQRLGLMKNVGSRANNLYPKEWRIRSGFIEPRSIFDEP